MGAIEDLAERLGAAEAALQHLGLEKCASCGAWGPSTKPLEPMAPDNTVREYTRPGHGTVTYHEACARWRTNLSLTLKED